MMRSRLDEQLEVLRREMIEMGSLCEKAIAKVAQALSEGDPDVIAGVTDVGEEISQLESAIETRCIRLLQQQQPVARDLRQVSAALKMITDMRRIGEQAGDIAEILAMHPGGVHPMMNIERMANETIRMVTGAVDAYVAGDLAKASEVIRYDDAVDASFLSVRESLIALISEDRTQGKYAVDLLMIAKYFERIGDHGVNIAGWVIFSVTGKHGDEDDE